MATKEEKKQAFESIIRQWEGGERRLAGARASELVYGSGRTLDEKLFDELREEIPGIEQYVSAPSGGAVVDQVPDEGGNPLSRQPESQQAAPGESNLSSPQAKKEQKAVDKALKPGRAARKKASEKKAAEDAVASQEATETKLDPDAA